MTATVASSAPRPPDPGAVWRVIHGYTTYWSVATAIELGIFDALDGGPMTLDALASAHGFAPDRLRPLLDALVGLELLDRAERSQSGERAEYALTVDSDTFLVAGRPRSMRALVLHSPGPRDNWEAFADTIRGAAVPSPADAAFYARLVRATFPTQHAAAAAVAPLLGHYERVLDIGAGAAPWAVALLEHAPHATAVVNDQAHVAEIAADVIRERALGERVHVVVSDCYAAAFDAAAYDVVVLAHVLRGEPVSMIPRLLAIARDALRPGGTLVVAEYFLDDDRSGPLNALLLGATMAASVAGTATYSETQFRAWLANAGFVGVERHQPVPFQDVMLATKPQER